MDVVVLKDVVIGFAAVLAAGLAIWNFFQSPSKENATAISGMVSKLTDHDRRIQHVENELEHLPNKDMVHELRLALVELQGTVRSLDNQVSTVNRTVANIDGYLRKGDPK